MRDKKYVLEGRAPRSLPYKWILLIVGLIVIVGTAAFFALGNKPTPIERAVSHLNFDSSVTDGEKNQIIEAIKSQEISYEGNVEVHSETVLESTDASLILSAYVTVSDVYAVRQKVSKADLAKAEILMPADTDASIRSEIAKVLGTDETKLKSTENITAQISGEQIALVPVDYLNKDLKLLAFDKAYYLDSFSKGAIFRQAGLNGDGAPGLAQLKLNNLPTKDTTLKVNQTGVTALTRVMMKKLNSVGDPLWFSKYIGDFLADADITHVSNEVSFKPGCGYSNTVFCSDPRFIETLKDSGVDIVELTGNHNNDTGSQYNTDTINLYHKLGWKTIGGGLNTEEAAKFYVADMKGSKVAFLAYNFPDSPNGVAIAKSDSAGANSFDFDRIKADIAKAKEQADFVIVDVQYWECYSYPAYGAEFPECDRPIVNQPEIFKKLVDLGANMVVGTQAHQPQTYIVYKGSPIYYGLGNLYFDQTQWPGTERGYILTHYFVGGKLVNTRLSPTVYDLDFQVRLMNDNEAQYLLNRLKAAR